MIASTIIEKFTQHTDSGNEYKLRYEKSQGGQIEYAQQLMALFPTAAATRAGRFQRSNAAVASALNNEQFVHRWRELYQSMPSNAVAIVSRWLLKMLSNGDDNSTDVKSAACFLFASRSTNEFAPTIELYCGLLCACWQTTEKTGMPRLLPLIYKDISKQDYERLARVLPGVPIWSSYPQIHALLNELQIPPGGRKNNFPRVMLIGLLDSAQWKNPKFDELMSKLPRGRADLFNLALGHVSKSFLLWAYMGMTVSSSFDSTSTAIVSTVSSSSFSTTTISTTTKKREFIPTIISSQQQQQQPILITEQLYDKLATAKARLSAAEQEALKAKQLLEQLELEAIREATITAQRQQQQQNSKTCTMKQHHHQTEPIRRHQSAIRLPDVLSLSDDDSDVENSLNNITRRLEDSFISSLIDNDDM